MKILKIDPESPAPEIILEAVQILKKGGLVVFPTETVYGLAANALDPKAIKKIFKVKGRPENKPLIILIAKLEDLPLVAEDIPKEAYTLAEKFWPGPLTLVLKTSDIIPEEITAGGGTVAVRFSSHPVALALTAELGSPITASSANLSSKPSHKTVDGILKDFKNSKEIELILDAGETPIGKPSTILDLTKHPPIILREGSITKEQIAKVIKII